LKEILFDFKEFKKRVAALVSGDSPAHYAFRRNVSNGGLFVGLEFRIYCRDSNNDILIFEKSAMHEFYDKDAIRTFSDECKQLASEVGATPGYFEDGTDIPEASA
jgi:hypothetical protein